MSQLPDVPPSPPALNAFLSRVKLAFIDLFARVTTLESADATTFTHEHITDFNKAVLDVLGNGGLVAGPDNIQIVYDPIGGTIEINGFHHHVHGDITDFIEAAQDAVAAAMVAGSNVTIVYDDALNTITISSTGGGGGGGGGPPFLSTDITDFNEAAQDAVAAALVAGPNVTISYNDVANTITISATGGSGGLPVGYVGAWEGGVTTGNTAATNTTNLNALIASTAATGGGYIWFNTPGVYLIDGTINMRSSVSFKMVSGARFGWTGSSTGNIFTTSSTEVAVDLDTDIFIDEGSSFSGTVIRLHSCEYCKFNLRGYGTNAASTFLHISADSTAGEFVGGGRNWVFNQVTAKQRGQCGIFLLTDGLTSGFNGQAQVVTDSTFHDMVANFCHINFQRFDNWTDSITFSGDCTCGVGGSGGIGVINNPGSPTVETGVYNIHWDRLSVDTFGTGLSRTGVQLNAGKGFTCDAFYQTPTAENGDLIGTNAFSYQFRQLKGDNTICYRQKGMGATTT